MSMQKIAVDMRKDILTMGYNCGTMGAHLGGSLSSVEILAVLFTEIMVNTGEERDRFIMSKAHSVMALYAALKQVGKITQETIDNGMKAGSELYKHPKMNLEKGIEFSGGSLGQGLSQGVGTALALKMSHNTGRVFVLLGDGECDEGEVWEAAASASHFKLSNLTVIIDKNNLQNDGTTHEIMNFDNMEQRWSAFGFKTICVDGHDTVELKKAFGEKFDGPIAIIADTVKGKGVAFAENVVEWHAGYLTKELYQTAMEELQND